MTIGIVLRKEYIENKDKVSAENKVNNISDTFSERQCQNLIKRQVQFTPEILLKKCKDKEISTEKLSVIHQKLTAPSSQHKSRERIFTSRFFSRHN